MMILVHIACKNLAIKPIIKVRYLNEIKINFDEIKKSDLAFLMDRSLVFSEVQLLVQPLLVELLISQTAKTPRNKIVNIPLKYLVVVGFSISCTVEV